MKVKDSPNSNNGFPGSETNFMQAAANVRMVTGKIDIAKQIAEAGSNVGSSYDVNGGGSVTNAAKELGLLKPPEKRRPLHQYGNLRREEDEKVQSEKYEELDQELLLDTN